ncbi:hypothetical protein OIV83_000757 [Microbotryomycetes sp. JL201]|nr:hypothetical protein OIV83_000757 [Microbotryomycetes sp. JL201]
MAYLSEPQYVYSDSATSLLSETRPLQLASDALSAVNFTLDELLQLWVHVSLVSVADNDAQLVTGFEPYSTSRFKAGLLKVTGPTLGNQAVLEAEIAIQELLKLDPSLTRDGKATNGSTTSVSSVSGQTPADKAHEVFVGLREWIHVISGLGAGSPGPKIPNVEVYVQRLLPPAPPPAGTSACVNFLSAVYAERSLAFMAEYLIRAIGRVAERGTSETATIVDVESAFAEDELIWALLKHMRVRTLIESEAAALRAKLVKSSPSSQGLHSRNGSVSSIINGKPGAPSSPSSSTLGNTGGRQRQSSFSSGLGIHGASKSLADDFETLMLSGQTRKVSLTPDRLRTVEKGLRSRPNSMAIMADSVPSDNYDYRMPIMVTPSKQIPAQSIIAEASGDTEETLMDFVDQQPVPPGLGASPDRQRPPARRSSGQLLGGAAMQPQASQLSSSSGLSTGSEADTSPNASPRILKPRIRPKDERKDLAHERQINHDLADFFATAEPPSARKSSMSGSAFEILGPKEPQPFEASPKRSRGAFSGLFSRRKKSNSALDNELERIESSTSRRVPPSVSGISVRSRASSQDASAMASMRAAGFSDVAASRASYVPPPLLGLGTEHLTPTDSVTPTSATFAEKPRTPTSIARIAPSVNMLAQSDTSPVSLPRHLSSRGATSAPLPPSLGAEPSSSSIRSASVRSHSSSYVSAPRQPSERGSRSASVKASPLADNSSRFDGTALAAGVGVGAVASGAALAAALGNSSLTKNSRSSFKSSSPRVSSNGHPSPRLSSVEDGQSASTAPSDRQRKLHERTMSYSSTHSRTSAKGRPSSNLADGSPQLNGLMPAADIVPGPTQSMAPDSSDAAASRAASSSKARISLVDSDKVTVSLADMMALRVRMITQASSVADCVSLLENAFGLSAQAGTDGSHVQSNGNRQEVMTGNEASMAEFYLGGGDERMSRLYGEQRLSIAEQSEASQGLSSETVESGSFVVKLDATEDVGKANAVDFGNTDQPEHESAVRIAEQNDEPTELVQM